jgi:hypothetical protein
MNGMMDWIGGMGFGWLGVIVLVLVAAAALKYLLSTTRKDMIRLSHRRLPSGGNACSLPWDP